MPATNPGVLARTAPRGARLRAPARPPAAWREAAPPPGPHRFYGSPPPVKSKKRTAGARAATASAPARRAPSRSGRTERVRVTVPQHRQAVPAWVMTDAGERVAAGAKIATWLDAPGVQVRRLSSPALHRSARARIPHIYIHVHRRSRRGVRRRSTRRERRACARATRSGSA